MKRLSILIASAALLWTGCSERETPVHPAADTAPAVRVDFRLAGVETDTSLEPMTRATEYRTWLYNEVRLLVLQKIGTRWIVDGTQSVLQDPGLEADDNVKISTESMRIDFSREMRPGHYRIVAVINSYPADWNDSLIPGTVVDDDADPSLRTPSLLVYKISTHDSNSGYRSLNREVFVAVADFTVPKSGDLHSDGMPPVELHAQRRVGKIRFLVKDKPSPEGMRFGTTAHKVKAELVSTTEPFAEGIDALGGMYYGTPGLYVLPWCVTTENTYHPSGSYAYQISQTNSTVFTPFIFADPEAELPFELKINSFSGSASDPRYPIDETFQRTLAAGKTTGLVFQITDQVDDPWWPTSVVVTEATDDAGNPENPAEIFGPFFDWNAKN